jgi:hypothetical protein
LLGCIALSGQPRLWAVNWWTVVMVSAAAFIGLSASARWLRRHANLVGSLIGNLILVALICWFSGWHFGAMALLGALCWTLWDLYDEGKGPKIVPGTRAAIQGFTQ